jgi:hypothetical protein
MHQVTIEEVEEVVRAMPVGKAPGPDGFTSYFYKSCWSIIGRDVWEVVEESRKSHSVLQEFNATFLTLIPKENEAQTTDKYHLISLCNVIYKIITKVIENRLKPILQEIISLEQGGFIEGRQILDGIIVAHESIVILSDLLQYLDIFLYYLHYHFLLKIIYISGIRERCSWSLFSAFPQKGMCIEIWVIILSLLRTITLTCSRNPPWGKKKK